MAAQPQGLPAAPGLVIGPVVVLRRSAAGSAGPAPLPVRAAVSVTAARFEAADERLLAVTGLDPGVVDEVTAAPHERDLAYAVYLDDGTSVTARPHPGTAAVEALGEAGPMVGAPGDRRVLKILSVVGEHAEDGLREIAADRARVQRTSPAFLEWNPASVDKGTGLVQVAALLGVPMAEVVAVGDAENDLPMFAAAGLAVAVAGAAPRAVEMADLHLDGRDLTDYLFELARGAQP